MTFDQVAQDFVAILEAWVASEMLRVDEEREMERGREMERKRERKWEREGERERERAREEERASGSLAEELVERERERWRVCMMCAAEAGGEAGAGGAVGCGGNDVAQTPLGGVGWGRGELVKYLVLEIARAEEKKMGWFHTAVKCQGMYTHTNTLSAKVCTHTHTKCQGMYTHTHTHTQ